MFNDVKVPKENRIGEDGFGFKFAMKTLSGGRIGIAAQALGIAGGAYELALKYSRERKAFGTEICNHQAIAFKLADMYVEIEAARHLVMKAAWEKIRASITIWPVLWQNCTPQKPQWMFLWKRCKYTAAMVMLKNTT